MVYYSNGGFNWNDIYYMPVKLREFYYKQLISAKDEEREEMQKANKKSGASSRIRRR
jgi:hypothetical protein